MGPCLGRLRSFRGCTEPAATAIFKLDCRCSVQAGGVVRPDGAALRSAAPDRTTGVFV